MGSGVVASCFDLLIYQWQSANTPASARLLSGINFQASPPFRSEMSSKLTETLVWLHQDCQRGDKSVAQILGTNKFLVQAIH